MKRNKKDGATENAGPGICRTWKMTAQIAGLENENVKLLKIIFGPSFSDPANSAPQKDYFLNNRITKKCSLFFLYKC